MFHSRRGMRPRWAGLAPLFPLPGEAHEGGSRPLGLKGRDMSPDRQRGDGGQHPFCSLSPEQLEQDRRGTSSDHSIKPRPSPTTGIKYEM